MANIKRSNPPTDNEISDFLSKVDEIDDVLKGLNSKDDENVHKYMTKADDLIKDVEEKKKKIVAKRKDDEDGDEGLPVTKTGFSKTSINKDAYKSDPEPDLVGPSLPAEGAMDQRAFMAAMEADASKRAERRKRRTKIANELKEKGNVEFKQGNYTKALEFYDQAMDQQKDILAIYTNRAQTRIKLGMFTEALTDCDWALRLWPTCLKAFVHQGHAYLGLKDFDNARDSYRQILTIDKKKEAVVNDYVTAVNREEQACRDEQKATQLFDEGNDVATGVVNLLTRIKREGQLPIYYSGGFRTIIHILTDVESQTLFRTNGGLQLPVTHSELTRCLTVPLKGSLTIADRDLISTAMNTFEVACKDNETSQQQLLTNLDLPGQLLSLLDAQYNGQGRILKTSCLNLMHTISLNQAGRAAIVAKFDLNRLITSLFMLMTKNCPYAETAAALLNNIALEKRLKSAIRDTIEDKILPAFESVLKSNKTPAAIVSLASSTFTNLAADASIRLKMCSRESFWSAVSNLMLSLTETKLCSTLECVLGLLVNVSTSLKSITSSSSSSSSSPSNVLQESNSIHESCFNIFSSSSSSSSSSLSQQPTGSDDDGVAWASSLLVTRCLTVLSSVLPHFDKACEWLGEKERVLALMTVLQDGDISDKKPALKCLTILAQKNSKVKDIMAENKGTAALLKLFQKEDSSQGNGDEDLEVILGNATLCLSHLAARPDVCKKLTKTNIIQRLLVLARDGKRPALQSNSAILIGKLVMGDPRHLERLRELHGIEILHGCMKHIK